MKAQDKKICTQCGVEQPIENFSIRNKLKGWRHSECKTCHAQFAKKRYRADKQAYLDRNHERRKSVRLYLWLYKSEHPCESCGESDPACLDFHHLRDKKYNIADLRRDISYRSIEVLKEEIAKCQVLCANCHRKLHARQSTLD